MTIKDFVDVVDWHREDDSIELNIMNDSEIEAMFRTYSQLLGFIEDKEIDSVMADGRNIFKIWLADTEVDVGRSKSNADN